MRQLWMVLALLVGCDQAEEGTVGIGDEMPDLQWEGYVNEDADGVSTTKPFVDYGTAELKASGRRYAMLHTSETF